MLLWRVYNGEIIITLLWFKTVPLLSTLHLCQEVALYKQTREQPENKIKMM